MLFSCPLVCVDRTGRRRLGNGRVQPLDGHALLLSPWERPGEGAFSMFTGRETPPVPDRLLLPVGEGRDEGWSNATLLTEPFEGGIFDDGFVEGHNYFAGFARTPEGVCIFTSVTAERIEAPPCWPQCISGVRDENRRE